MAYSDSKKVKHYTLNNNNRNYHEGKYKLLKWKHLTSDKDWWMIDSVLAKQFLNWYTRVSPEFKQDVSMNTLIAAYMVYERYGWGYSDWRFCYGHDVA